LLKFLPVPFQTCKQVPVGLLNHPGPSNHYDIPACEPRLLQAKALADYALNAISCYGPAGHAGRDYDAYAWKIKLVPARQDTQSPPK